MYAFTMYKWRSDRILLDKEKSLNAIKYLMFLNFKKLLIFEYIKIKLDLYLAFIQQGINIFC